MLVLSRKVDEVIDVGGDIEIHVLRITPQAVRLGIKAPPNVKVHRREVSELIARKDKKEGQEPEQGE